jgi:hypothetical protein
VAVAGPARNLLTGVLKEVDVLTAVADKLRTANKATAKQILEDIALVNIRITPEKRNVFRRVIIEVQERYPELHQAAEHALEAIKPRK